jgi:hypothetical protein
MRSYTKEQIINNLENGNSVWHLDTNGYGEDDYLVGDKNEVLNDILYFHNLNSLPSDWELTQITDISYL